MRSKFYCITRLRDMGENSKIDFFQVFLSKLYSYFHNQQSLLKMWSFEVHYVVVAQKISQLEWALYEKNRRTSAPPIHTFFEFHQYNVPQKIKFFMNIYDYENENTVQSEKFAKIQFYCFHPCHVGVLCSKIWRSIGPLKCGPILMIFTFSSISFS